jgi:hypothetical protein
VGDEAIAATVHGLDEPWLGCGIAEHRSELRHGDLQHPIAHVRVGPDHLEELFLRDELSAAFEQHPEHAERLGVQVERTGVVREARVAGVEPKTIETQDG